MRQIRSSKLFFLFLCYLTANNDIYCQKKPHPLSFEARHGKNNNSFSKSFYHIQKDGNKYKLMTRKGNDILKKNYDTIIKNTYFIKTVIGNSITIYRSKSLIKIKIPNLQQVYFKRDGLDVLTKQGAQYYDNSITKINSFPKLDAGNCGTVYSKQYTLKYIKKTKKYSIELSKGNFGAIRDETVLEFIDIPNNIESMNFLNDRNYISNSVNNPFNPYPNLIKIQKEGKVGLYSYNLDEAIYSVKEKPKLKVKNKEKEKPDYAIDIRTGDTIFVVLLDTEIETPINPISFLKKGSVKLQQVLSVDYNQIQQNSYNGLIYLYKNNQIGIYPNHTTTSFNFLKEKTTSFYEISKNGKKGWLDIKTFKEYYFKD